MQLILCALLALTRLVLGALPTLTSIPTDGSDLENFVTRPDLRPPIFDVSVHDPTLTFPGYIFLAPYERVKPEIRTRKFSPAQVGPHIYDSNGDLIWSGAQIFKNRNTYSFRPVSHDVGSNLSFSWGMVQDNVDQMQGAGMIMNPSFEVLNRISPSHGSSHHDMHEFNVLPDGKTALRITAVTLQADIHHLQRSLKSVFLINGGFQEVDLETRRVIFDWWALDYLDLNDSDTPFPTFETSSLKAWDVFHVNSVDKEHSTGNYLVSIRHYNAIFLISGRDGSILWQIGGQKASISLKNPLIDGSATSNYSFVGQHDARFHNCDSVLSLPSDCSTIRSKKKDITVISLFDNGWQTARPNITSRSLLISVDTSSKTAVVMQQHLRPDNGLSFRRGNVQYLPSGNAFVGWSERGYVSEHMTLPDGKSKCIMEASFRSPRLGTYRSYKFGNFIGQPTERIAFKHFVYGPAAGQSQRSLAVHVFYVSWNGATEVHSWRFYHASSRKARKDSEPQPPAKDSFTRVGSSPRRGFETSFTVNGWKEWAWVEAIDKDGVVLGSSSKTRIVKPREWEAEPSIATGDLISDQSPSKSGQESIEEDGNSETKDEEQGFPVSKSHDTLIEPEPFSQHQSSSSDPTPVDTQHRNLWDRGLLPPIVALSVAGVLLVMKRKIRWMIWSSKLLATSKILHHRQ